MLPHVLWQLEFMEEDEDDDIVVDNRNHKNTRTSQCKVIPVKAKTKTKQYATGSFINIVQQMEAGQVISVSNPKLSIPLLLYIAFVKT